MGTEPKVLTENQVKGIKTEKRPHAAVPPYRSDGQTVRASARAVWGQSGPPAGHAGNACVHPLAWRQPLAPGPARRRLLLGPWHSVPESGDTPPTAGKRASTRGPRGMALRHDTGPSWRPDRRTQEQDPATRTGWGWGGEEPREGWGECAGAEKPSAQEQPVGCSSFVQEATREGESGGGEGAGPRDGSQRGGGDGHHCSIQVPTQHRPRGPHSCSMYSKSKNKQMKIPHSEIKAVRMTPNPLQMKNVTPWARGGAGKNRITEPGDTVFGRCLDFTPEQGLSSSYKSVSHRGVD